MALNKTLLLTAIKAAFMAQAAKTEDPEAALDDLAGKIAGAIHNYVRGASIVSTPANVATAAMSNAAGPVVAASNLVSNIS